MRDPKKRMKSAVVEICRESVWYCAERKKNNNNNSNKIGMPSFWSSKNYWRKSVSVGLSEVLRNTGITLSRIHTRVLNAGITARLDIADDRLIVLAAVCAMRVDVAVVWVLTIVASRGVDSGHVAFLRCIRTVGCGVGGGCIGGAAVDVTVAVVRSHWGAT